MPVKYYSNKSNAKRAAVAAGLDLVACHIETSPDGKGFAYVPNQTIFPASDPNLGEVLARLPTADSNGPLPAATDADYGIPATPGPTEAPVGIGAALVQLVTGAVEAGLQAQESPPKGKTAGFKVEKNREEQNGIKRPSVGGLCRAVWDALDAIGTGATAKDVKALAATNGWNINNASIEFYQWRKFNGIVGRQAKAK